MLNIGNYSIIDVSLFLKRKVYPGFKIHNQNLVIDIGSGDKPFWRADVFFDNIDLKNDQRCTNGPTITTLGPFINGDIYHMPFKDRVFDFSFCSHVLEHLEHPELAIQEIIRISKKGYIEVPNGVADSIHPFSTHLWFIYLNDKKLIFIRKDIRELDILTKNGANFTYLLSKIKNPFIELYWESDSNIEYEIIDTTQKIADAKVNTQEIHKKDQIHDQRYYIFFIKLLRKLFLVNKNIDIENLYKDTLA